MKTLVITIVACIIFSSTAAADSPLKVVTTLSSYADITKTIGGEFVDVSYVASPRFNPHFIEPRPSDVLKVKRAGLFIHSGLDLEAWRDPLLDAAARSDIRSGGEHQLDLSKRITLLEVPQGKISRSEGDIHVYGNPHYWIDPRNGLIIAQEIAEKLREMDPAHQQTFQQNLSSLTDTLNKKIAEWQSALSPLQGSELIGYHNEWIYLMEFTGMQMKEFLEPKPGIPPSPKHLDFLTNYAKEKNIRGIVQATFYSKEAAENVARKTGAAVVLLCQNVGELPQASDYVSMVDYNITQIIKAFDRE